MVLVPTDEEILKEAEALYGNRPIGIGEPPLSDPLIMNTLFTAIG